MYFELNQQRVFCSTGNGILSEDKPSVIFLHGAGMEHSVWVLPARYFARQGYNVFALDLPGHGRSEGLALDNISCMSEWLHEVIHALNLSKPAIVGHSMGSLIALSFAAKYSDSLRALALLGISIPMPVAEPLLQAARDNSHVAIDIANTWSHSSSAQLGGNDVSGINMLMSGQRLLERNSDGVFYSDLKACNKFTDALGLAENVSVKTLMIIGEQDKMTAASNARKVAGKIRNCSVTSLKACGHAMLSEQPNAVLNALITIV